MTMQLNYRRPTLAALAALDLGAAVGNMLIYFRSYFL
jgi:hypothetical protein